MSSALKPVITSGGPQNTSVASQMNKPMHSQGPPSSFEQTSSHMPQNLVNISHSTPNTVHNPSNIHHPNVHSTQLHYSLNVPNASQHYGIGGNNPVISHPMPISNHPIPNINQAHSQTISYNTSPPKNPSFPPTYQPNLGHPPHVSSVQNLPITQQQQAATPFEAQEKPQSNGTSELKLTKPEQNHISPPKERVALLLPEKVKLPQEKPPSPVDALSEETSNDSKAPDQNVPETSEPTAGTATITVTEYSSYEATNVTITKNQNTVECTTTISTQIVSTTETESQPVIEEPKTESTPTLTSELSTVKAREQATPKSTMKLATTPRTPSRKSKIPKPDMSDSPKTSKSDKTLIQKSPSSIKRTRTKTQPYQSPLPEFDFISKMSTSSTPKSKSGDEKLIIFYKNEFLAVRNSEGGFYICQAVQNIYKSSPRIKIRWLSQDKNDKSGQLYTPDFYDHTDFDCILTNLNLERVDKGKFRLPPSEKERTDSILQRALAVEKGDATPTSLTEEHPDGLDLSLYKEESQLQKRKGKKRKASSQLKAEKKSSNFVKSPDQSKVKKVVVKTKPKNVKKISTKKPLSAVEVRKPAVTSTPSRSERAKRRQEVTSSKTSPVVDQKKARVLAKVARKTAIPAPKNQISTVKSSAKISKTSSVLSTKVQKQTMKNQAAASRKPKRTRK